MSIKLHKERGINPVRTYCPICKQDGRILIVGANKKYTCENCETIHVGKPKNGECQNCGHTHLKKEEFCRTDVLPEVCEPCQFVMHCVKNNIGFGVFLKCDSCGQMHVADEVIANSTKEDYDKNSEELSDDNFIVVSLDKKYCHICGDKETDENDDSEKSS